MPVYETSVGKYLDAGHEGHGTVKAESHDNKSHGVLWYSSFICPIDYHRCPNTL